MIISLSCQVAEHTNTPVLNKNKVWPKVIRKALVLNSPTHYINIVAIIIIYICKVIGTLLLTLYHKATEKHSYFAGFFFHISQYVACVCLSPLCV